MEAMDLKRFESKFVPVPYSGCWIWIASLDKGGYGQFSPKHDVKKAHRISYEHYKGPIPKGINVCHSCDVRDCVNPDHLFLGTHKDNTQDMISKGRGLIGGKNPFAKAIQQLKGGIVIGEFITLKEADRATGISYKSISNNLTGRSKSAGGYEWRTKPKTI